jgi:choline monooxygenase
MSNYPEIQTRLAGMLSKEQQLPAICYTDSEYHDLETRQLFESGWMAIGYESEYSKTNHSWSEDVLGKPLLVTRDDTNVLRVFNNVCRHRGHLLQDKDARSGKLITCPYHAWCFALDGQFIKAPFWDGTEHSEPNPEQKSTMGLIPVRFGVWYDLLFVNLSGDAEPFETFVEPLKSRWAEHRPADQLRRFSTENFSLPGNWKLVAENFLDNYHLPWIHPELGSSTETALGLNVENLQLSDNIIGFSHPTAGKDKGKTTQALPSWPALKNSDNQPQELFVILPNICFVMEGYYLWSMILFPSKVDQCDEKLALYVVGDEAMDTEFDESREQLKKVIHRVNNQDEGVVKSLQKGRQTDAASNGVYTDRHDQLGKWFHQTIARKMLNNNQ